MERIFWSTLLLFLLLCCNLLPPSDVDLRLCHRLGMNGSSTILFVTSRGSLNVSFFVGFSYRGAAVESTTDDGTVHGQLNYGARVFHQSRRLPTQLNSDPMQYPVGKSADEQLNEPPLSFQEVNAISFGIPMDDVDDGIPKLSRVLSNKSRSIGSKKVAIAKVSEVSSLLGRACTVGLGKAVNVFDTLGSSMTNLNLSSSFASNTATKGNKISIFVFEVANTIVKGANLMHSFSEENVQHLKEVVLPLEGVHLLMTKDMDGLLRIAAADKSDELKN